MKTQINLSKQDWIILGTQTEWIKHANVPISLGDFRRLCSNFSHFTPNENGNGFHLFKLDKCENCGGYVEETNAITVNAPTQMLYESGLIQVEGRDFPEVWACDECGGSHCDNCECTHGQ